MSETSGSTRRRQLTPRLVIFLSVAIVGLLIASVAYAGWTTISLTNGSIDTTWGAASYSELTNDPSITDRDDIKNAWVRYDGTNIYFRIETWAGPVLSNNNYRAVGAIDCNGDGDFNDPIVNGPDGDRLVVYFPDGKVNLVDGAFTLVGAATPDYSDSVGTNIEWGVPLYFIYPACRGSISPVNVAWSTGTGAGAPIDQSESYVQLSNPMDYGDTGQSLPNPPATCGSPYTGLQCDGARHGIMPYATPGVPLRFGDAAVDADPGNLQSAGSDADDTNGTTPDDEGGIAPDPTDSWDNGNGLLTFKIVGAGSAKVGCWVDFNKNGTWTDTGETILNNVIISAASTSRGVTIPGGLSWPNSFPARCRIYPSTVSATNPFGPSEFGEVEDHIWEFDASGFYISTAAPTPVAATNLAIATEGETDVKLTWLNPSPNDSARLLGHATNPYFTSANAPFVLDHTDNGAPWEHTQTNVRGDPAESIYYIVYGRYNSTDAATPSNRVGLFEYGLVQGQP